MHLLSDGQKSLPSALILSVLLTVSMFPPLVSLPAKRESVIDGLSIGTDDSGDGQKINSVGAYSVSVSIFLLVTSPPEKRVRQ